MEDQNNRRFPIQYRYPSEDLQSLLLSSSSENLNSRYRRGLVSSSSVFDPQSLVSSLSGLSLTSSDYQRHPQIMSPWPASNFVEGGGSSTVSEEFRTLPFPATEERSNGYHSNFINGQSNFTGGGGGSGYGGTHLNPSFVRTENWQVYPGGDRNSWGTSQWPNAGTGGVYPQYEFGQSNGLSSFLRPKKQLGYQFRPCSSIVPCSSRITRLSDFNGSDAGLGFNGTQQSVVRANPSHSWHDHVLNMPLIDLKGKIMLIAKDQFLSRILQDKFESPSPEEIEMVISEVIDHMDDLMTDQYGNYLFQKLVKVCNVNHRARIIDTLSRPRFHLVLMCRNVLGSRSVQKLLECISGSPEQISMIISALLPGILELATDQHGYHVLQQCLKSFPNNDNELLVVAIARKCYQIATNRCGCVVLHTCVDECSGELRSLIVNEIIANASHLSEDPFGNYVVQRLLDLRIPEVTNEILRQLTGNFFFFSRNKFASNVVEKCLTEAEPEQSEHIIMELLRHSNLSMLLVDPYGNFVMQSAFSVSQGRVRSEMLGIFERHTPTLKSNLYGKNILQMLEKKRVRVSQSSSSSFSNMY